MGSACAGCPGPGRGLRAPARPPARGRGLTQVRPLLLGPLPEQPLEQQAQVAEDDEGRRQGGPLVVLHDEVVALKLPERVRVALHHLERVAVGPACGRGARAASGPRPAPRHSRGPQPASPPPSCPLPRFSVRLERMRTRAVSAAPSALLDGADLPPEPPSPAPVIHCTPPRGPAHPRSRPQPRRVGGGAERPLQPQVYSPPCRELRDQAT